MLSGCTKEEVFLLSEFVENSAQRSTKEAQVVSSLPKIDATTLSPSHIAYYAQKWAGAVETNPEYDYFDPNDANLVSQALKYSGLQMESDVWEFDSFKSTREERSTPSWRDSKCLPTYLVGKYNLEISLNIKESSEYENYKKEAKKGDIIFLGSDQVMLVTMFEKKWVDEEYVVTRIFYCSSGKKNEDLAEVLPKLGAMDTLRIIRLQI